MLNLESYEMPPETDSAEPLPEQAAEARILSRDPGRFPLRLPMEPRPRLSVGIRVAIFVAGWLLILVGVAGLVLPGIQGIATILIGAALLSLDNELIYRGMRRGLARWPRLWNKVEHFRERSHDWIHRTFHRPRK